MFSFSPGSGRNDAGTYLIEQRVHYNVPADEALFVLSDASCEIAGGENCEISEYIVGSEAVEVDDLPAREVGEGAA